MALSCSELDIEESKEWIVAGHCDTGNAHRARWPRVSSRPTTPDQHNPPIAHGHAVPATIPTLSWIPNNYGIPHDDSWCPRCRRCDGSVAVFYPRTLQF